MKENDIEKQFLQGVKDEIASFKLIDAAAKKLIKNRKCDKMNFKEWFENTDKIDTDVLNTMLFEVEAKDVLEDIKETIPVTLLTEILEVFNFKDINTLDKSDLVLVSFYGSEYIGDKDAN